jgi:hypothetical protein
MRIRRDGLRKFRGGMPLPLGGVNGLAFLRFLVPRTPVPRAFGEAPGGNAGTQAAEGRVASRLIVPLGLAISCLAHVAFLGPALLRSGNPFDTPPVDAIAVDIVTSEEVPQPTSEPASTDPASQGASGNPPTPAAPPSQPTAQTAPRTPAPAPSAPTQSASLPPRPARPDVSKQIPGTAATLPLPPPPFTPQTQMPPTPPDPPPVAPGDPASMFAMPLTMPDGSMGGRTFDSQAVDRADIENDVVTAFRSHLKTCSKLPAGVSSDVRVVLRIYLKPDGTLATGLPQNPEPIKVEGVSLGGGALYQSAVAALRKCQPYRMLPADRYTEWKTLDITLTPQNF